MYSLLNSYDIAEGMHMKDESIFIERSLNPFLNAIFPVGGTLIRDGHFTFLIGDNNLKPDVKYSARVGSSMLDFLVFEIKSPKSAAKDDLFKLSLEMQLMINRFDYDIYRMELVAPFIYLMIKARSFHLPRTTYDLTVALTTIPALMQLQQLTYNQVIKARTELGSGESEQTGWTRSPLIALKSTQ
ncbi:hypothetical protein BDF14DRAFT_1879638 [Spinellus fusiger]|nr:hypothetical protein BDF14DRAFT_1879638 [Spinellus fusiger]